MAIHVDYTKKIGKAVIKNGDVLKTVSLYQGNCFLVFLDEVEGDDGKVEHYLYSFFSDIPHAKNCLGLTKGNTNIFDDGYTRLLQVVINPTKYAYTKELLDLLVKAFDQITIEIDKEA